MAVAVLGIIGLVLGACQGGTSIGAFIFQTPNRTTVAVVGAMLEISWSYTPLVKQFPSEIDISLQPVTNSEPRTFPIKVLKNQKISSNNIQWQVQNLNDGDYQMRIAIAGRDTLLNNTACLQNGEAIGASSAIFKVVNAAGSPPIVADRFGPAKSDASQSAAHLGFLIAPLLFWI